MIVSSPSLNMVSVHALLLITAKHATTTAAMPELMRRARRLRCAGLAMWCLAKLTDRQTQGGLMITKQLVVIDHSAMALPACPTGSWYDVFRVCCANERVSAASLIINLAASRCAAQAWAPCRCVMY